MAGPATRTIFSPASRVRGVLGRRARDGDALVRLGRHVVRHEAERPALAAPLGRAHADTRAAQRDGLPHPHQALLHADGHALAQHEHAVHLLGRRLHPGPVHAHVGIEVGRQVELVGQDAVGFRRREAGVVDVEGCGPVPVDDGSDRLDRAASRALGRSAALADLLAPHGVVEAF